MKVTDGDPAVSFAAVIVAAGSGSRFGGSLPKQFVPLAGRTVLDHSVRIFQSITDRVIVVVPRREEAGFPWKVPPGIIAVEGGSRRQDSVLNGVRAADQAGASHVLIHDGARPAVDEGLIRRVMEGTLETGACIPCLTVSDTVKLVEGAQVRKTLDRSRLRLSQTPQGFRTDILIPVLERCETVTDEALAMEAAGYRVTTVPGSRMNIKITTGEDMEILERIMGGYSTVTAAGLDFHRFDPGRPLIVCGIRLGESGGLQGHSDGDAVLHAVADSILAAARIGDIGTLFPPSDPRWKDADSSVLLEKCIGLAREKGFEIENLDVTVIGEVPRISPNREAFISRLAEILSIPRERIWIKGTTTNTLGDLGKGHGLGCLSMAEMRMNRE